MDSLPVNCGYSKQGTRVYGIIYRTLASATVTLLNRYGILYCNTCPGPVPVVLDSVQRGNPPDINNCMDVPSWAVGRTLVGGSAVPTAPAAGAGAGNAAAGAPQAQVMNRERSQRSAAGRTEELPLLAKRAAGKFNCLPTCAIVTLCREPWVPCCASCIDRVWCAICCRWCLREGKYCTCAKEDLDEPSMCEEAGKCLLYVPLGLMNCMCSTFGWCGITSGCICYCPSSACGLGCIAPYCPGCYCIKMTDEEQKYWAGKKPFDGGPPPKELSGWSAGGRTPGRTPSSRGPTLVVGEPNAGDPSTGAASTKVSKAAQKAEAKRKEAEEAEARRQQAQGAWGALVGGQADDGV